MILTYLTLGGYPDSIIILVNEFRCNYLKEHWDLLCQTQIMKNNNYKFSSMNKSNRLLILLLVIALAAALKGIGLNPIRPLKLNKGATTKYMFFINP